MRTKNNPIGKKAPSPTAHFSAGLAEFAQLDKSVALVTGSKVGTKTAKKAVTKRHRLRFSFWLNPARRDEELVADQIELLKNDRMFASVCRDGIMLVTELRQGSSTLLVKLFDWLRAPLELYQSLIDGDTTMLFEQFPNVIPQSQSISPEKIREMEAELKKLRKEHDILEGQVAILEQVIISTHLPTAIQAAVHSGAGEQTSRVLSAPPPVIAPVAVEVDTSSAFLDAF